MWIVPDHLDDELDIPTPDRIKYLRGAIGKEVLWDRSDIVLDEPSPSPVRNINDDNDDNDPCTPPGTRNPQEDTGAALAPVYTACK
jgi:hypothetical protein